MIARALYSLLWYLATPFVWLRLARRGRRQPEYLHQLGERFGLRLPARPPGSVIWVHAVSVGETRAAEPLLAALLEAWPEAKILLTHMTPTGRDTGNSIGGRFHGRVVQCYLPYDYPGATRRFLAHFRPRLGLLMETELWPNLVAACKAARVPLLLVNARLSEKSAAGYARFAPLARPAFAALAAVAAQTEADAARIVALGAQRVTVSGNLKFDVTIPEDKLEQGHAWRRRIGERPVWLAASTREGEEVRILDAYASLVRPDLLLVLVPRHPQRFDEVADLVALKGLRGVRRSQGEAAATTQVWIGDSMGEMAAYYGCADLALIGGSLLPFGGQNLIEAAACGCPVLIGPHTFNFQQAAEDAVASGAARRVADPAALPEAVAALLDDRASLAAMRDAALTFSRAHRGATARTMAVIRRAVGEAPAG